MPMPWAYRHASKDFRAFLDDAMARMDLVSDNSAYTAIDAVFQVFRRRVSVQQGLDFAAVLPAVPRAIFVTGWDVSAATLPFGPREDLAREVQAVRKVHNLTPPDAIEAVAWTVRRHVHQSDLDKVLARCPAGAIDYWRVVVETPGELDRRIV